MNELPSAELTLELERKIDQLCDEFEDALKRGVLPDPVGYLNRVPSSVSAHLICELVELLRAYTVLSQPFVHTVPPQQDSSRVASNGEPRQTREDTPDSTLDACDFGDFQLLGAIGRGGMGTVYRAHQRSMSRMVALKLLVPGGNRWSRRAAVNLLRREALATAQLQHPNIVAVYEVGELAGQPYYAMQLVDGQNLGQLSAGQPLECRRAATYMLAVARAVHEVHLAGILHRDLKPSNILIDRQTDRPLVADFGLAKVIDPLQADSLSGDCIGSPPYMSPEQVLDSRNVSEATDVYGLGATLYHLITGRAPFVVATVAETLHQVLTVDPLEPTELNPSIDRDLNAICSKCLEKDSERRYATALELADDLQRYLEHQPVTARPIGRIGKTARWARRNRLVAALGSITLVSLIVGTIVSTGLYLNARSKARIAADAAAFSQIKLSQLCQSRAATSEATGGSIPWMTQALRFDSGNPTREMTDRVRLAVLLERTPSLEQMWFHTDEVASIDVSHDGRYVLSGGHDGIVRVVNLHDNDVVSSIDHGARIVNAGFGPDGRFVVTAGTDKSVRLWRLSSGGLEASLPHQQVVLGFAFSHDGELLACLDSNRSIRIWQLFDGEQLSELAHDVSVESFGFGPDGSWVFTAAGNIVSLWDVHSGECRFRLPHHAAVIAVQVSQDGSNVETLDAAGTLRRWASTEGEPVQSRSLQHLGRIERGAFSPDRRHVATTSADGMIRLWRVPSGKLLQAFGNAGSSSKLAFSPDSKRLLAIDADVTVRAWEVGSGEPLGAPMVHAGNVSEGRFSLDGQHLVTASKDHAVRIWRLPDTLAANIPHGKTQLQDCALSGNGRHLVLAGQGNTARVIDLRTEDVHDLPVSQQINAAVFGETPAMVWTGSLQGTVQLWNVSPPRLVRDFEHGSKLQSLAVGGRLLATAGEEKTIELRDAKTGRIRWSLPTPGPRKRRTLFSRDGRYFADACGPTVRLWRVDGRNPQVVFSHEFSGIATDLCLDSSSTRFAAASADGQLIVHELKSGQNFESRLAGISFVAFSRTGKRLLVGHFNGRAEVFDADSGKLMPLTGSHAGRVVHGDFDPAGLVCATVGLDGWLRVWDATSGELVRAESMGTPLFRVFFAKRGGCIVTASQNGDVAFWKHGVVLNPIGELEHLSELLTGHRVNMVQGLVPLTPAELKSRWQTRDATRFGDLSSAVNATDD